MTRISRSEYREKNEEKKKATDDQLETHREISPDAEASVNAFNDATNWEVLITEDADEINRAGELLDREIQEQSEAQMESVKESGEVENQEVSDLARRAEQEARHASEVLETGGAGSDRFYEPLSGAASVSREIERFFGETAEDSEQHQRDAKETTERQHADIASTAAKRRRV